MPIKGKKESKQRVIKAPQTSGRTTRGARFESTFVSHAIWTADIVSKIGAPVLRTDSFETAQAFIGNSKSACVNSAKPPKRQSTPE